MTETCKECRWWVEGKMDVDGEVRWGECRGDCPQVVVVSTVGMDMIAAGPVQKVTFQTIFPTTAATAGCGRFVLKPEVEPN